MFAFVGEVQDETQTRYGNRSRAQIDRDAIWQLPRLFRNAVPMFSLKLFSVIL
jgi:hypothetical protein